MSTSDILSLLLLITTVISVGYAYKAYHHQRERAKKDAACALAKVYVDEILDKYSIVAEVLSKSGILSYVKETFPMDAIRDFTMREVLELAVQSKANLKELSKKMDTFDHFSILNAFVCKTNSMAERNALSAAYSDRADDDTMIPKNEAYLKLRFTDTVSALLNTLEWFSMNCRYGLADEEVLYQSLHQTFLSTVWMMYYYISMNNASNVDKYYTNVIWLFTAWKTRLGEESARYREEKSKAEEELRAAREQCANAGRVYAGKSL